MPVICFISPQGGCGRTTAALLLALEIAATGQGVILIDADPNAPLVKWASLPSKPINVEVVAEAHSDRITEVIYAACCRAKFVLIDLQGRVSAAAINALYLTDLALVPLQHSVLDSDQAARTFRLTRHMQNAIGRPMSASAVFTRTPAAKSIRSSFAREIHRNMLAANINIVRTPLAERSVFKALFAYGGDLTAQPPNARLESAHRNAASFADDVLRLLPREH